MSSSGHDRHTVLVGTERFTFAVTGGASPHDGAFLTSGAAEAVLRDLIRGGAGGARYDLAALHDLLVDGATYRVRDLHDDELIDRLLVAVGSGRLRVLAAGGVTAPGVVRSREEQVVHQAMAGQPHLGIEGVRYRLLPAQQWRVFEAKDSHQVVRATEARGLLERLAGSVSTPERRSALIEAASLVVDSFLHGGGLYVIKSVPAPALAAATAKPAVTPSQAAPAPAAAPAPVVAPATGPYPIVVTSGGQRLARAWFYLNEGGVTTVLRTDGQGVVRVGGTRLPEGYVRLIKTTVPRTVRLFYSLATFPLPDAVIQEAAAQFWERSFEAGAVHAETVPVKEGEPATESQAVFVDLPALPLSITGPEELALWPLAFELPTAAYETAGLNQGAAHWHHPDVHEGAAAPAPPPLALHPLALEGRLHEAGAPLRVRIFDERGTALTLRAGPGQAEVAALEVSSAAAAVALSLLPAQPERALGLVQIVVVPRGAHPPLPVDRVCQLVGLQLAMVDDAEADLAGSGAGPQRGEADDKVVVDFTASPGWGPDRDTARAQLEQFTRVRRMVVHQIRASRVRPYPGLAEPIAQPEMPLWMMELQLLGLGKAKLRRLLDLRTKVLGPGSPHRDALTVRADFGVRISWTTPDVRYPIPRHHFGTQAEDYGDFRTTDGWGDGAVTWRLALEHGQLPADLDGCATPARPALPFPAPTRRRPRVVLEGQRRPWGRQAGAPVMEAIVLEHQPAIVDEGREIIRGADCVAYVGALSLDGRTLSRPSGESQTLRTPTIRLMGQNLPEAVAHGLIDAFARETFATGTAAIQMLPLDAWQFVCRRLAHHESGGRHFFVDGAARMYFGESLAGVGIHAHHTYHGWIRGTPKFGAPSGFGYGQHDPPHSLDDMWSIVENIRETVRFVMLAKADESYRHLTHVHALDPAVRHDRAVFRRELVRAYNGGREFIWQQNAWRMRPTVGEARRPYVNGVLGTHVHYDDANPPALAADQYGAGV